MQAGQKVWYSLYFKHPTSYVQCLWSPLLSDQGVLSELFVTVPDFLLVRIMGRVGGWSCVCHSSVVGGPVVVHVQGSLG